MDEDAPIKLPTSGQKPLVFGAAATSSAAAVAAGVAAGNIVRQTVDAEVMELPEVTAGWLRLTRPPWPRYPYSPARFACLKYTMPCPTLGLTVSVQASAEHMRKQQELMHEIELRRKMKATVVPTNDQEVRRMLRQLGEPMTLFGEREVGGG